ncbi:hypothetical protein LR48_Vigan2352s000100 [Vigna angularis]|nr:hypothetical protein LR48_Vigan2352s000100 [Vigna angularis]
MKCVFAESKSIPHEKQTKEIESIKNFINYTTTWTNFAEKVMCWWTKAALLQATTSKKEFTQILLW